MPRTDGIDISHWNKITDWAAVPPFRLVSLKATEGKSGKDNTFAFRREQFRNRGTEFLGYYHWLRSDSPVIAQVANLIATVGALPAGEFIQNDWETTPNIAPCTVAQVVEFNDRVRQHYGRDCVITYSSDWVPGFAQWRNANPSDGLWYANYNTGTGAAGGPAECAKWNADLWQWSSTTKVAGFAAGIDVNEVRNWSALERAANRLPPPVTPPPTIPAPLEVPDMILVRNAEAHTFTDGNTYEPNKIVWELVHGELRHVSVDEYAAIVSVPITGVYTNAQLAKLPRYSKTITGTISGTINGTVVG